MEPIGKIIAAGRQRKPDLYYLKSTCEDAERRGKPFSAIFWWSMKPKQ